MQNEVQKLSVDDNDLHGNWSSVSLTRGQYVIRFVKHRHPLTRIHLGIQR